MRVRTKLKVTITCAIIGSTVATEPLFSGGSLLASLSQSAKSAEIGLGISISFKDITRGNGFRRDQLEKFSPAAGASFAIGESCMLSGDYTCAIYCFTFRHRAAEAALVTAAKAEEEEDEERCPRKRPTIVSVDRPTAFESARASANLAYVLTSQNRKSMLTFESVHIYKRSRRLLRRCLALCDMGLAPLEGHPAPWLRFAAKANENSNAVAQGQALRDECVEALAPLLWEALAPTIDEPTEPLGAVQHWEGILDLDKEISGIHDRQQLGTFALLLALHGESRTAINYLEKLCNYTSYDNNVAAPLYSADDACEALLVVKRLEIAHNLLEIGINGPTPFEEEKISSRILEAVTPLECTSKNNPTSGVIDESSCGDVSSQSDLSNNESRIRIEDTECCASSCINNDKRGYSCFVSKEFGSRTFASSNNNNNNNQGIRCDHSSSARNSSSSSDGAASAHQKFPSPRVGLFLLRSSSLRSFVEDHRTLALTIRVANRRNPSAMANSRLHVLTNGNLYGAARHLSIARETSSSAPLSLFSATSSNTLKVSNDSVNTTLELVTAAEARLSKWWMEALGPEAQWLLGGVHVLPMGRLPFRPADLNYLRKIFTILVVCRSRGYGLFVSLDDDILLSPAALAAMVAASDDASADLALRPHSEGGLGCSMVAPTLSTGIPTVEAWMEDFLPKGGREAEALNQCFAKAALEPPSFWNGLNLSSLSTAPLAESSRHFEDPSGDAINSPPPWNGLEWYASVWKAAAPTKVTETSNTIHGTSRADAGWLDGPIYSSLGAGVHPVRWNLDCTVLAFRAARARLATHFGPMNREQDRPGTTSGDATASSSPHAASKSSQVRDAPREAYTTSFEDLPKLRLEASTGRYPYLCNSAWASTPEHLMAALAREDLASFAHPFDEASMSAQWLHEPIKAPLCVLRGAFGVHPLYGGTRSGSNDGAVTDAPGGLEATMHREAAKHLRAALNLEP